MLCPVFVFFTSIIAVYIQIFNIMQDTISKDAMFC